MYRFLCQIGVKLYKLLRLMTYLSTGMQILEMDAMVVS